MATAIQKITLSPSRDIPFNKLALSQANVRRMKAGVSIEELAEDIARRGLLQSLNVRPILDADGAETGLYEIPAGGRRYRALERLVKQKRLAKTAPVPCVVRDPATPILAEDDSLAENLQRAPLHPLDQFRAFQALRDKGQSEEDIAAAFFTSAHVVKQRLRLASVSPKLLDIYAEDGMTLEQLMAFTVSADHARQEQVWETIAGSWSKEPYQIRRMLTEKTVRASDRRAVFVGLEAYEAAGGTVLRDLFQQDDGGWLADVALLETLVAAKLKTEAEAIAAEGWKWIEVAADFPYGHTHGLRQIDGVAAERSADEQATIADLIADEKPATLYLVVPPSDISRTKPLIRLVLNQIGRRLTEDLHARDRRHRVLMMLDEFPALGRLDFFESALAFMAGYGLKSFLIAQSLNQIEKAYGPNNAILDNCHVRVSFATNDERTAKRVSDALGTATEMKAMRNYAGHRLSPWLGHLMVSRSETARPLLTPGEVMQLPATDEIVMAAGVHPIRAKKARYFEDHRFKERILPSPEPAKCGRSTRKDAWSELKPQRPDAVLAAELDKAEDAANGGLRREPELPDHVAIAKETTGPAAADEFAIMLDDEPEDAARQRQALRQQMRGVARQVALDPNDGIDL